MSRRSNIYALISIALLTLFPDIAVAQNVTVTGKTNKTNAIVRVMAFNDLFSLEQKTVAETHSDSNGVFVLNADIKVVTPAQIAVDLDRVDVVLSPDSKYDLEVFVPQKNEDVSFFEQEQPSLKINSANDGDLMEQLIVAEQIINDYVTDNVDAIYRGRKAYLIDTIENRINSRLGNAKHDYVNDFIRYKLAALKMAVVSGGAKTIINKYFDNQSVLYNQNAYFELFNEAFEGFFISRDFNQQDFNSALYSDYGKFMGYLKNNAFMTRNAQLAELIVIKYLSEIYYENPDLRTIAKEYLNEMKTASKYMKNREVASDVLVKLQRLSYDTKAPEFSLADRHGKIVGIRDFNDGMVLLQFVDKVSTMTDHQFAALDDLQRQWNDTITVVTIAAEESFDDFVQLFDKQHYNWQLLNLGTDILLLEEYNIKTCPDYVILKTKGRIGMAPAPAPDHYLEYYVRRIYRNR